MTDRSATTSVAIHPLLRDRWSPRAFDLSPLPRAEVLALLEAARWAPSSGNGQPWRFVMIPRADAALFARALSCLNEGNSVWAQHAPLLLLAVAKLTRDNGAPNRTALYDLGQAVAHLTVQAAALDLWVHQMAGFREDEARATFAIPAAHAPVTFIAVGHLGDDTALSEELRTRERTPRTRNALASFVFGATWGEPSPLLAQEADDAVSVGSAYPEMQRVDAACSTGS